MNGEKDAWEPYRDEPDAGDWGDGASSPDERHSPINARRRKDGEEVDWDVEKAAEGRDVQVMFTVPKARLRVVNADVERASVRSVSDGASASGSTSGGGGHDRPSGARRMTERDVRRKPVQDGRLVDLGSGSASSSPTRTGFGDSRGIRVKDV